MEFLRYLITRTQAKKETAIGNSIKRPAVVAALTLSLTLTLAFALAGCSGGAGGGAGSANDTGSANTGSANNAESASGAGSADTNSGAAGADGAMEIKEGETLTIQVADISDTAKFYPIEIDGTAMEILAVKAPDGTIRTAFNTCEVCYDSGRGYYKQDGDALVCQNCGNRFKTSQVEARSRGCNPWPIFAGDKVVTDETITISYDFLSEATQVFANWKRSY
ncbi:MAG: DUF2318 domain-containing protein [Peptococcaceae bacterium]|nr:DUF2318 domain-containing protein [Peptococcaceae bacterium]